MAKDPLQNVRQSIDSAGNRVPFGIFNKILSNVGMFLFALMFLAVGLQMLNRWFITEFTSHNFIWTESLSRYLLVIVTFYGAAIASRDNDHVKITFLMKIPPNKVARAMSIFGYILILGFLYAFAVGTIDSYYYNIGSQFHALPIRPPFTKDYIRIATLISLVLMAIYAVRDIYRLITDADSLYEIY